MNCPAVLFLVFNRPDLTELSFAAIRKAQPKKLFIAADGPRNHVEGEEQNCMKCRGIVSAVDWDCDVKTLFRDENLGCGLAIANAIDWFFEAVDAGIILEDDCVPVPEFFQFCKWGLHAYVSEPRIMQLSGTNVVQGVGKTDCGDSIICSNFGSVWGWATWKRAWKHNDLRLENLTPKNEHLFCQNLASHEEYSLRRLAVLKKLKGQQSPNTWDYQWGFARALNRGLSLVPPRNLVSNIGFRGDATHTIDAGSLLGELQGNNAPVRLPENLELKPDSDFDKRLLYCLGFRTSATTKSTIAKRLKEFLCEILRPNA